MHGSSTTIASAYPQIFLSNSQPCSAQRLLRTGHTYVHNDAKSYKPGEMGREDQELTQSRTAYGLRNRWRQLPDCTLPFPLAIEAQLTLRLGLTLFHAGPKASCTVHLISQSRRR